MFPFPFCKGNRQYYLCNAYTLVRQDPQGSLADIKRQFLLKFLMINTFLWCTYYKISSILIVVAHISLLKTTKSFSEALSLDLAY